MEINEQLTILANAVIAITEQNKALTDKVNSLSDNTAKTQSKAEKEATKEEIDEIIRSII